MATPALTRDSLADQFRSAGISAGDGLIVHSSMRSLGPIDGGPAAVIGAILDAIGPGGTLLMPTFADPQIDSVFDVLNTPSRVGLITEVFRTYPGVERSWHPTHAVSAIGKHTEWLLAHERTSGLGPQSPLHRAALDGAKVLMLGCAITSCSIVHVAEAIERVPYLGKVWYPRYDRTITVTTPDGQQLTIPPLDPPTCSSGFAVVQTAMESKGLIAHPKIAQADSLLFSGLDAIEITRELLRRDAGALLCANPRCAVCASAKKLVGSEI